MSLSIDHFNLLTLNVGFAQLNGDWNWQHVRSPFVRIYYVTEGSASLRFFASHKAAEGREVALRPGHLYIVPPFALHSYHCDGPFAHYYVHFLELTHGHLGVIEQFDYPLEVPANPIDLALFQRLHQIYPTLELPDSDPNFYDNHATLMRTISESKGRSFATRLEARGILYTLFSRFFRHATERMHVSDDRIQRSIVQLRERVFENPTVEELAEDACLSSGHYIRSFKQETGLTPMAFLMDRKMEQAQLMLITSDLTISQISDRLAFQDTSYFNRVFRRHLGLSPQQYRQQAH